MTFDQAIELSADHYYNEKEDRGVRNTIVNGERRRRFALAVRHGLW